MTPLIQSRMIDAKHGDRTADSGAIRRFAKNALTVGQVSNLSHVNPEAAVARPFAGPNPECFGNQKDFLPNALCRNAFRALRQEFS